MGAGYVTGKVMFCLCGPKGSVCCFLFSLWAIIMLFFLGVFYYLEAVVLLEDIIDAVPKLSHKNFSYTALDEVTLYNDTDITKAYHNAALSCWGAAVIYLFFLVLSGTFIGINIWRSKHPQKATIFRYEKNTLTILYKSDDSKVESESNSESKSESKTDIRDTSELKSESKTDMVVYKGH